MDAGETAATLRQAYATASKLAALTFELLAHAETVDVPAQDACVSMTAWLRDQVRIAPAEAKRQLKLARALEKHHPTAAALAAGALPVASAAVIVKAVDALPAEIEPALVEQGERQLLDDAKVFDTYALGKIADRLDYVLDPEGADERDAAALARAQAKAERQAWCHLWFDETHQEGTGRFGTDLLTTRKLARILEALMNPGRPDPIPTIGENGLPISADERRGLALTELIDRIAKDTLPTTGGCDPVIVVTMSLETLLGGTKAAILDTGERISPSLARRLAAKHGVIPAVLGTKSEVLDLGRKARLATKNQRLAMSIQQHGSCAQEHCDRPITWADAHHLHQWQSGGSTDLVNLVGLCRRHHRMADHPDYEVTRQAPGLIRINRRT